MTKTNQDGIYFITKHTYVYQPTNQANIQPASNPTTTHSIANCFGTPVAVLPGFMLILCAFFGSGHFIFG
jgi:hypothetical protein